MKKKYAYEVGERKPNPNCKCSRQDKSECFKEFAIWDVGTKKETSGWKIFCPYFDKINKEASKRISEGLNKIFFSELQ